MASLEDVVIVSAVRTPIGKFQGSLSDFTAPQLGAIVVREAVKRAGIDPNSVDECIMGNVVSAGLGQNPARQAALGGGLSDNVSAMTINKVCGSGLKAVALGQQAIQTGNSHVVVAGGMESMTNAPYLLQNARKGFRLGDQKVVDSMVHDGLWDVYNDYHMGNTGENVAEKYHITREEQDEYALNSHRKAISAMNECRFKDQIVPVELPAKKKGAPPTLFSKDESPREDTTIEALRSSEAGLQERWHRDGRQCAGRQRWRLGIGADVGGPGEGAWTEADGAHRGAGHQRPRSRVGDDDAGRNRSPAVEEDGMEERGRRPVRDQRGVLGGGDRGHARAGNRSQQGQREWRRSGARDIPSAPAARAS